MGQVSQAARRLATELDGPGPIPSVGEVEIFLRSFMSTLILGSTQPPIKLVPGDFSGGKCGRA